MLLRAFQLPRIDRLATVYLCHPVAKFTGWTSKYCVPILTYHSISENLFGRVHPYHHINTPVFIFALQMKWLRQAGYRTIGLSELLNGFETTQDLSKTVVLTFDDGYKDFYTDAFPILKQCGFSATVFLATDRIRDTPVRVEGADYLTWNEVRELHSEGITFGSHSVTHADLRSLGPEQIDYELGYSKESIEQKIGTPVESFSYPFAVPEEDGDFIRYLSDTLENVGYVNGVSSTIGRARPKNSLFFLPRLSVNSWDDVELLRAKLEGGYDWLHWPQWFYKFAHHNVALMTGRSFDQVGSRQIRSKF
jgi:peptidoglycan/xylan/chitin deacetylase (PgdA/CDA1 family)